MKCFIVNRQDYSHPSHAGNTVVINLMGFVLLNLHFLCSFLLTIVCLSFFNFLLLITPFDICFYYDFIIVRKRIIIIVDSFDILRKIYVLWSN